MGALAAAFSKTHENVVPRVVRMLAELEHRGRDMHGIATVDSLEITRSPQELPGLGIKSNAAIGHNLSCIFREDVPQPVQYQDAKLVLEGRFFPLAAKNDVREVVETDRKDPAEKARDIIKRLDGSYAFAFLTSRRLFVGRDSVGLTPLYYGEDDEAYVFASERKALWALGIQTVNSFPPGNLAIVDSRDLIFQPIRTIIKPEVKPISMKEAAERLQSILGESVNERVQHIKRVAMAFSGGLDSSVLASLAKSCNVDTHLIYVGMEGDLGMHDAERTAELLDLPLHVKTFAREDVEEVLRMVLWLIEEPDALKVSVAIPFYWIAQLSDGIGLNVLLAGQGSDELFGGYHRYLREYESSGVKGLEDALYRDVTSSYMVNFERDNKVCAFHNVELRLPFADYDLIHFSLSLPVNLKIASTEDQLRKRVLRKVAKRLGLPSTVYNMRKGAIQYTTGVDRVLRRLAKEKELSLKGLIEKYFLEGRDLQEKIG